MKTLLFVLIGAFMLASSAALAKDVKARKTGVEMTAAEMDKVTGGYRIPSWFPTFRIPIPTRAYGILSLTPAQAAINARHVPITFFPYKFR